MAVRGAWLALVLLSLSLALFAGACGGSSPHLASVVEARSDKPRIKDATAPESDVAAAVQGNNAFGFDLYQTLRANADGNLILSPYSISVALAMTYAGARGDTEAEMARTLHFLSQDRLHPALNAIDLGLVPNTDQAHQDGGDPLQLDIANSLWGQRDYGFAPDFLDTLAQYYGAGLRLTDFAANPDGSREAINRWVSDQTKQRIPELIPNGLIDEQTRLVLANAIYFKAGWLFPFDAAGTKDGPFHRLRGSDVQVPMMSLDQEMRYAEIDGAQAVELPYAGGQASMLVIVPDQGNFASFEAGLSAAALDSTVHLLEPAQVQLSLPKFDFGSEFSLSGALQAMGMPLAFSGQADFSGMNAHGERDLYIKDVVHKANITVDEQGTEAAAATAVVMASSAPSKQVALKIDRPFIFLIRDDVTGLILFAGRVLNPAES